MRRKQKIAAVVLCVATVAVLVAGIVVCLPKPSNGYPKHSGAPSDLPPLDAENDGLTFDIEQQTRESGAKVLPDEGRGSR